MPARKTDAANVGGKNIMTGLVPIDVAKVGKELEESLIELTDLHLRAKQAHWNLAGAHFKPLHEQLDELTDDARAAADAVAERAVAIGYAVDGRPSTLAKSTPLHEFPAGQLRDTEVVGLIAGDLQTICTHLRKRVDVLDQPDRVSQDLLIGVLATLEKHHWMFAVQQVSG